MNKSEGDRRKNATELVLALFTAYPNEWISWRDVAKVGGVCAWRTRISDARRIAKRDGAIIEWNKSVKHSAYRLRPKPLGRDASVEVTQKALF